MHVTVYGITTDAENIYEFSSCDLDEDSFAAGHYDYWKTVQEDKDVLAGELAEFFSCLDQEVTVGHDEHGVYITLEQDTINEYFRIMYIQFKEALKKLNAATEKDMQSYYIPGLSEMKYAVSNDWDGMIYSWENGWQNPQDFMRSVEPGTRYYICGAVDAHY